MITRQSSLSGNVVSFCRYLRAHGFPIGVEEEANALQALTLVDPGKREIFRRALKAVLCKSQKGTLPFDALFDDYFHELKRALDSKIKERRQDRKKVGIGEASFKSLKQWLSGNRNTEEEQTASYSPEAGLNQQDFGSVRSEEVEALQQVIKSMSRKMAARAKRRYARSANINFFDVRATIRKNLRMGGELIDLVFKKPGRGRQRLVILCDMSRSMELYSSFFLQFMFAFCRVYKRTEVFTFSTSLNRITPQVNQSNFENVRQAIAADGGTRIGEALKSLMDDYGHRMSRGRTRVVVVSDGWDQGESDLIGQAMGRLRGRTNKIIWLNPLAGHLGYRPETAGMKAALPFVDVLAAVHNIESLKKISKWL